MRFRIGKGKIKLKYYIKFNPIKKFPLKFFQQILSYQPKHHTVSFLLSFFFAGDFQRKNYCRRQGGQNTFCKPAFTWRTGTVFPKRFFFLLFLKSCPGAVFFRFLFFAVVQRKGSHFSNFVPKNGNFQVFQHLKNMLLFSISMFKPVLSNFLKSWHAVNDDPPCRSS